MITGYECKAYHICNHFNNTIGHCRQLGIPSEKEAVEDQLKEIKVEMATIRTCLASIVSILDQKGS